MRDQRAGSSGQSDQYWVLAYRLSELNPTYFQVDTDPMGFDVTYHPISEAMLHEFYFDLVSGTATIAETCALHEIPALFEEKLESWVANDRQLPQGTGFDATIGFHAAAAAGVFRRYHYLRGCMLSEVPSIHRYTKPWDQIAPAFAAVLPAQNRITENYCSGVFIPAGRLAELRADIINDPQVRTEIHAQFPGSYLAVLLTTLDEALEAGVGLLEATDIIEPHPFDLNQTKGTSNRLNCDPAGALLYQETAIAQASGDPEFMAAAAAGQVERVNLILPGNPPQLSSTPHLSTGPPSTAPNQAPSQQGASKKGYEIGFVTILLGAIAAFLAVYFLLIYRPPTTDSVDLEPVSTGEPWPLWDETLLLDNCWNSGTAEEQVLSCVKADGTLEWIPEELPSNCRMIPVPNNMTLDCRSY